MSDWDDDDWDDDWDDDDDDDDDDWDDDDDCPRSRGWYAKKGYAARKIGRLFTMIHKVPMSEEEREEFQDQLEDLRKDLNDAEDDDDLEDILEELDDLEDDIEDEWDEAWEEDWDDIFDLPWDDSFWGREGAHLPLRVSCSAEIKGKIGEQIVANLLAKLPNDQYHVMNDVLIEIGKTSSQIDHIVVSQYGIFVIETKNYAGIVLGQEDDYRWTQVIGENRRWFYSPLKQNERHMQVIERCIKRTFDEFVPVVVFSRNCDLKVNTKSPVLYADTMLDYIRSYDRPIYSKEKMAEIEMKIRESSNPSYQARLRHKMRNKR